MLLESRGEKKLTEGSYEGKKRTERAALSKKGVEKKKKKDKNNKEKREKVRRMRSKSKKRELFKLKLHVGNRNKIML